MKKYSTGYTALCCFLSACMVFLYHTGASFINVQAKEEETAGYQIPKEEAGMQVYLNGLCNIGEEELTEAKDFYAQELFAQDAFCRQADAVNLEPVIAADAVTEAPMIHLDSKDYECLLKIVESEAGICDQKGKILIANVVINRMQSQYFPDTVEEVVYQKNQFSPVENGAIDRVSITEDTVQAVSMALSGTDYSQGALFFAARDLADKKSMEWFDESLNLLFEHDGHEFFAMKE